MVSDECAKRSFADSSLNKVLVSHFSRICSPSLSLPRWPISRLCRLLNATQDEKKVPTNRRPHHHCLRRWPRQHRALCSPPTAAALARSMPHPASPPQWPDAPQDQEVTLPLSVLSPHQQRDGLGSSPPFAFALASALATRRCPRRHTGIPVASPTNDDAVSLLAVLVDDPAPPTTRPYTRRHPAAARTSATALLTGQCSIFNTHPTPRRAKGRESTQGAPGCPFGAPPTPSPPVWPAPSTDGAHHPTPAPLSAPLSVSTTSCTRGR